MNHQQPCKSRKMSFSSRNMLLLLWILNCVLGLVGGLLSASFYGASYIHVPLEHASTDTTVRIHFRTSQPNGLLLLAGGVDDHCAVELLEGRVQVRLDLGSGEATLGSAPGLVFNDLHLHSILLTQSGENVRLQIDNITTTSTTTPGSFHELNVNRGLFLGGFRPTSDVFYGLFRKFRGCMQQVFFNSVDVLAIAREDRDPLHVYEVSWDCGLEFGATSDQPISFIHNSSFIAFPTLSSSQQGRLTFDLRTRSEIAMLVYTAGNMPSADFLALEIVDGDVKLTVNKGSGVVELFSENRINDGLWHQVEVLILPGNVGLSVDGQRRERVMANSNNRYLDLSENLFVGGISVVARVQAVKKNLASLLGPLASAGSLIGCLQNFKIHGELHGFREALVTKGLHPECLWSFPCTTDPCIDEAICVEDGYYFHRCLCERDCFRNGSSVQSSSTPMTNILHVQDLVVREAERSFLHRNNIDVIINYDEFHIRDSSVLFKVVKPPAHGELSVEVDRGRMRETIFTMMDLKRNKVSYAHDGSETRSDSIGMELQFIGAETNSTHLHDIFKETYGFTLIIQIAPWNDKPQVEFPQGDKLVLVTNTYVNMTPNLLRAVDQDDPPAKLEFTVQYQQGYDIGYFEIKDLIGVRGRIRTFTQEDIDEGKITFVHRGNLRQQVDVRVSDRKDVSDPKLLHIEAVPLALHLVVNSGLIIPANGFGILTYNNLSFATNAPNQDLEIRYEVTDPPYVGELHRQHYGDGGWTTVSVFSQEDIKKGRIRYFHYGGPHPNDYFKFKVVTMNMETDEFEFEIQIIQTRVDLTRNEGLLLRDAKEGFISMEILQSLSSIPYHGPTDIVYNIDTPPDHGSLYRVMSRTGRRMNKRRIRGNFTQADVNDGKVLYQLHQALFDPIDDSFEFTVQIPGFVSEEYLFLIQYEPVLSDTRFINNGIMDVAEGSNKVITEQDLYMETDDISNFQFTIIEGPHHGVVQLINADSGSIINHNITAFTNHDIRASKVYYRHDDSETMEDYFSFLVTPILHEASQEVQEIHELTDVFEIKISLRNDNPPRRVIDKPFHVVANRGRIITIEDLKFVDPDVDFDSADLVYTIRKISNGKIVRADNRTQALHEFTQRDLAEGKVYFVHLGTLHSSSPLRVTDGASTTVDEFQVQASDPYIRLHLNTGLSVAKGQFVVLTASNLSIDSNLDVEDREVKILLKDGPYHGRIKKNGREKTRFNMADIKSGTVLYEHDNTDSLNDQFGFAVKIDDIEIEAEAHIKILLDSHQKPPRIASNKVTGVDEMGETVITDSDLLITHSEAEATEIKYTVTSQPRHGTLHLHGTPEGKRVRTFTQADINQLRLYYRHKDVGQKSDSFVFDVSNGVLSLHGQEFVLEVVPSIIPMEIRDFTIEEGGRKTLSINVIRITNVYYQNQNLEYVIVKEPMHGSVEDTDHLGSNVVQFNQEQVNRRMITYFHDDSDTTADAFSLMARVRDSHRKSNPHTLHVTIVPNNDEPPIIAVNERLRIWTRSTTPILPSHLRADDKDTPNDQLIYAITKPSNGDVTMMDSPNVNIVTFTQRDIQDGKVMFAHRGSCSLDDSIFVECGDDEGSFMFQVNDGDNLSERQEFYVYAQTLVLSLEANQVMEAFPGIDQPITASLLKAVTNDVNQTRPILYALQSKPSNGILGIHLNGSDYAEVTSFSQMDIDSGSIFYRHTSGLVSWKQEDSFTFEVSTAYAQNLPYTTFSIRVSYEFINEDNRAQLISIASPVVHEGDSVALTKDNLDISQLKTRLEASGLPGVKVHYVISSLPKYGWLICENKNVSVGDKFTQKKLNKGLISYTHDHSDSLMDAFTFVLEIQKSPRAHDETALEVSKFLAVFNITIIPENDQPFQLRTNFPSMELVQGFTRNITTAELNTEDPDTPPQNITYEVISGPSNGYLVKAADPDQPITMFTQDDINRNRIIFIQDGSMQSGAFYFKVSDGKHKALFKVFNIRVHPLTLELLNTTTLHILQGYVSAYLSQETFALRTNGDKWKVMYNVTRPPRYGQLYMHDSPVHQFSHKNIAEDEVSYIQTDLTSSMDDFGFIVYDMQNVLGNKRLEIKVIAQVTKSKEPLNATSGQSVVITKADLDASKLAAFLNDNPVYSVYEGPNLGTLSLVMEDGRRRIKKRDTRKSKDKNNKYRNPDGSSEEDAAGEGDVMFTHEDILHRRVHYMANPSSITEPTTDGFSFILSATNAQPAHGTFEISVLPGKKTPPSSVTPGDTSGKPGSATGTGGEGDGSHKASEKPPEKPAAESGESTTKSKTTHLLIIYIISGVVAGIIILVIIIKCCRKKKRKKLQFEASKEDSKSPLSQQSPFHGADMEQDGRRKVSPSDEYISVSPSMQDMSPPPNVPSINVTSDEGSQGSLASRSARSHSHGSSRSPQVPRHYHIDEPRMPPRPSHAATRAPSPPQSPDPTQVDSRTVPTCKVTPLLEGEEDEDESGELPPYPGEVPPNQVTFDWEKIDPELLQHCRTTNPVLHDNKYWV